MSRRTLPPLVRLTEVEARAIESMFRVYDYKSTGRIPQHLAYKLCCACGFDFSIHSLPANGTLKEILLFLDMRIIDPEPQLYSQLHSFTNLVAKKQEIPPEEEAVNDDAVDRAEGEDEASVGGNSIGGASVDSQTGLQSKSKRAEAKVISAAAVNEFYESLGRPPISQSQCDLLLTDMLNYDDCQELTRGVPGVMPEVFIRDFSLFAKKSNALKNFK